MIAEATSAATNQVVLPPQLTDEAKESAEVVSDVKQLEAAEDTVEDLCDTIRQAAASIDYADVQIGQMERVRTLAYLRLGRHLLVLKTRINGGWQKNGIALVGRSKFHRAVDVAYYFGSKEPDERFKTTLTDLLALIATDKETNPSKYPWQQKKKPERAPKQKAVNSQSSPSADTNEDVADPTVQSDHGEREQPEAGVHKHQESGQVQGDEDADFDSASVLEEYATRNRWPLQRQVQTMIGYWQGANALNALLREVSDEAEFRAFLVEQEKMPSPKETVGTPCEVLLLVQNRLSMLVRDIKVVDWAKDSASDCRQRLDGIVAIVEQLRKEVPNEH